MRPSNVGTGELLDVISEKTDDFTMTSQDYQSEESVDDNVTRLSLSI